MQRYFALFRPVENGWYAVEFPDLECGYTQGENLADALDMAEDLISCVLARGRKGREYEDPSDYEAIQAKAEPGVLVFPVSPNARIMEEYRPKKRVNVMLPGSQLDAIAGITKGVEGLDRSKFIARAIDHYLAEKYPEAASMSAA
jgi:predicted RNase H-like HicB family nuclease